MRTHVALLRGINVAGKNPVAMPELQAAVEALGHRDVVTYIRTGNIAFSVAPEPDDSAAGIEAAGIEAAGIVAAGIERAVAQRLGVNARVVVLTCAELARVVAGNPFPASADPRRVHVVFLPADPVPGEHEAVAAAQAAASDAGSRDEARIVGRAIYLHTPDGFGRSVLVAALSRRSGPMGAAGAGTARNWTTVTKLLALCG